MAKIYLSNSTNPYENLALEEYLTFSTDGEVLFLWQNKDVVVIGNHQNAWAECDVATLDKKGVTLARRTTGGGAVFHDLGNLNFSFISPESEFSAEGNLRIIVDALRSLGINAVPTGRNDVEVEGAKVSGNAFLHKKGRALHHGTLLVNSDLTRLSGVLTVDSKKLASKGIKSVRARVANLTQFAPVTVASVQSAIINSYARARGGVPSELPLRELYEDVVQRFASTEFVMGENPRFCLTVDERFDWGSVKVHTDAKGDVIERAVVYTDALDVDVAPEVTALLKGVKIERRAFEKLLAECSSKASADVITAVRDSFFKDAQA